ncbi:MAG: hypothetical protein LBS25_08855, partial [Candidatus Symbiothrix sp.]|nr:hypothetical protein [Candidatus Symbiothrix sp.]
MSDAPKEIFVLVSPKNRTVYNFRGDLIREIINQDYQVYVTGPNQTDVDKIEALGVTFIEIPMNKNGIGIGEDIRYTWRLYCLFKQIKPSVILGYTIKPVIYGSIAAQMAKVSRIFSMITGAGYLFANQSFKAKILRRIAFLLYKIGLGGSTRVIFQNSDDLEEFVAQKLVTRNKCFVVNGSGVNMQKFQPADYPSVITFFMLSRMIYGKGVIQFFQAAERVKNIYPEARFVILGNIEIMNDAIQPEELNYYVSKNI